jgi:hypothetical protein
MHLQLRRFCLLLLPVVAGFTSAAAQEVLQTDGNLPQKTIVTSERSSYPASGAKTTTLSLPFFDDFSSDAGTPDTARWFFHPNDTKRPTLSNQKGHNPPSKGVATFDGVNKNGLKYQVDLATGLADSLTSQPIDLSGLSVADSLYLSFFIERGGTGEFPETTDSIVVYFDSTGDFEYVRAWGLKGLGSSESKFQIYHVLLDSNVFFHNAFRFKFVNFGSLNGELDQFHLDYVYLNSGRSNTDADFVDVSASRMLKSPMYPYTAMPRKLYPNGNLMTGTEILVSNAGDPAGAGNLTVGIDDPTGNNIFSGTISGPVSATNLDPFDTDTVSVTAFSDQSSNILDYGAMRLTAIKTSPNDPHRENDTLRFTCPMDSILAMDDGVADFGYGLTNARAFCQEFHIPRPDTLVAVWMRFAPSIYYNTLTNQSFELEGKGFRLVVWDSLSVDSSLVETSGGMNVHYGTSMNEFVRYQLITESIVPTTFWVGMRQVDGQPVGLGFDKNSPDGMIYYETSTAEFQRSTNVGTLMIRPEFRTPSLSVSVPPVSSNALISFEVAPHPIASDEIRLVFAEGAKLRDLQLTLTDLQGRTVERWENIPATREVVLPLGSNNCDGLYLLQLSSKDQAGQVRTGWQKLLIRSN